MKLLSCKYMILQVSHHETFGWIANETFRRWYLTLRNHRWISSRIFLTLPKMNTNNTVCDGSLQPDVASSPIFWTASLHIQKDETWCCNGCNPHALDSICSMVSSEMDLVTKELSLPSVEHITPDFISNWSFKRIIEPTTWLCPSLVHILEAAAQTWEAKRKNKIKSPKTVRSCFCSSYTSTYMWLGLRCSGFSACVSTVKPVSQVSIRLWAFSLEYWIVKEDNRCPLSLWPFHLIWQHRKAFMPIKSALYWACKTNHMLSTYVLLHDNINISSLIFMEQRGAATPAKVQSGTFGILYAALVWSSSCVSNINFL